MTSSIFNTLSQALSVWLLLTACACAQEANKQDWPWFLGQNHTGVSNETDINLDWVKKPPAVLWQNKVGTGYSAPSVRGDRLVLHHRIEGEEITECFSAATGKSVWKYRQESDFRDPYGYNNGPRCTPVLTKNRCYTLGAGGHLACVELETGKRVWSRDLHKDYEIPRAFFGVGCTPIVEGDKLIVLVGGQPDAGVVAFDLKDGKPAWSVVGKSTWNGKQSDGREYEWTGEEQVVSYSSPIATTINGRRHVLCLMRQGLVSLDPATGKERFHHWFRAKVHESVNAARPVVIGDQVLLSSAYRQGSVLLKVNAEGNWVTGVWRDRKSLLTHWSTAIVVDGYAYGFSGRHEQEGEFRCIDLKTGELKWKDKGYDRDELGRIQVKRIEGGGPHDRIYFSEKLEKEVPYPLFGRGSKIRVGKHFIVLSEHGSLTLVKINPEKYEQVARIKVDKMHYPAWTAPVLSRGRLYLRCEDALVCLDMRPWQEVSR